MTQLTAEQLKHLSELLDEQESEVRKEFAQQRGRVAEAQSAHQFDEDMDRGEESVALAQSDVDSAIEEHLRRELDQINYARQRLADGSFGSCVDCGAQIGYSRLRAYPTATRCVSCQSRHEQHGRRGH
jgi:RNA polymerase-binding protein DksA